MSQNKVSEHNCDIKMPRKKPLKAHLQIGMYVIIYLKSVKLQDSRIHLQNTQLLIKTDGTDFE